MHVTYIPKFTDCLMPVKMYIRTFCFICYTRIPLWHTEIYVFGNRTISKFVNEFSEAYNA